MRKILLASVATIAGTLAMTGGAKAQPVHAPAAGTLIVHLNGALNFQIAAVEAANSAVGATPVKYSTIDTVGYLRLYPGFDGMTVNGLQYGVASEFRDTTGLPNGAGVNESSNAGAIGATTVSTNGTTNLYIRRAYGYVGTADAGFLRFGQGDGAFSLLSYGDVETFGDAQQWNSDLGLGAIVPAGKPNNLFSVAGALYSTSKLVYLSPSLAGFNFGVSYEPNSNGIGEGAAGGLSSLSSIKGSNKADRRNTVDGMVGYTTAFLGAKIKASAGYLASAPLGNSVTGAPIYTGAPAYVHFQNMGIAQYGVQATYLGVTLGVNYKNGAVNDGYTFLTTGERHDSDLLFSGVYTIGPVIVGASYFFNQSAGGHTPTGAGALLGRTETNKGVAIGANYVFTKNFTVYTQYLYGSLHQHGATYKDSYGDVVSFNNVHTNAFSLGAALKW